MNKPEAPLPGRAAAPNGAAISAQPANALEFDPQQAAIALAYNGDNDAPRVVAKGRGLLAQAIIERAHQHGVYVHESRELVALLIQVDLDQRIPPALYRAVAELLAWVYRLEQNSSARPAAIDDDNLPRLAYAPGAADNSGDFDEA
ncbi:MAG: EscU/YscU/HrcU family type III secretion system export apparatus switch protein [Burkholderiales bacterium]|nr:EscU/YscU/HrcU family type III secretion system export apparatus switch protein [Burkholderiales bacterium]